MYNPTSQLSSSAKMIYLSSFLLLLLLLVGPTESIVKQSSSQSSSSSPLASSVSSQQQQQQARSDDSSQQQVAPQSQAQLQSQQQSAYNNHQSAASNVANQQQPTYSSSVSISSSSSASSPVQSNSGSQAQNGQYNSNQYQPSSGSSSASSSGSSGSMKQSNYMDNPENSYHAAASSVNMALANSGIFNNGYGASAQAAGNQQQSASPVGSQQTQPLNPLHYFYYPPKESSAATPNKQQSQSSMNDMMSNAASNQYQSMAYPSSAGPTNSASSNYADQLSAYSNLASSADLATSAQDSSYMAAAQPMGDNGQQYGAGNQQSSGSPQLYAGNGASLDLSSFASNTNPQQSSQQQNSPVSSGISFNGPSSSSSSSGSSSPQSQPQSQGDYMGLVGNGNGYQSGFQGSSLFNQLGDLSTSNFGNNPGGLSSVASYMQPPQQQQQQQQSSPQQQSHDLFGANSAFQSGQFNSAASQLAPASIAPPAGNDQRAQSSGISSLFSSAPSLFGGNQQQQQQQQANQQANSNGNLFASQSYLNSFMTPQQYTQLTGQQLPSAGADLMQPAASSMAQQHQQQLQPAQSSAVASTSSAKRFGLSSLLIPALAVAGLSLLIPTISNIGTAVGRRKKRSVAEERASQASRQATISYEPLINGVHQIAKEHSIGEYMDQIERYYSIYKNAVESDDCMNRLVCEFGSAVRDVTGKSAIVTVIERVVPTWMVGKVHLFKEAAMDSKEGKEKCRKYICHSSKNH